LRTTRTMIVAISVAVVVIVIGVLTLAATKSNTISIRRETTIDAPPAKVFAIIDDFHNWKSWAPQDVEDATMTRSFSGASAGKGAVSEWDSTKSAGKGRMEITEVVPLRAVTVVVDFQRPLVAHNVNRFELEPAGSSTHVTWIMHGTNPYIAKVMSLFVNMDSVLGKHFESGLANLKAAAER